jgi:hypothetical protein
MPALDANADATAPTAQINSPVTRGVLSPARPPPTASTVPYLCKAAT